MVANYLPGTDTEDEDEKKRKRAAAGPAPAPADQMTSGQAADEAFNAAAEAMAAKKAQAPQPDYPMLSRQQQGVVDRATQTAGGFLPGTPQAAPPAPQVVASEGRGILGQNMMGLGLSLGRQAAAPAQADPRAREKLLDAGAAALPGLSQFLPGANIAAQGLKQESRALDRQRLAANNPAPASAATGATGATGAQAPGAPGAPGARAAAASRAMGQPNPQELEQQAIAGRLGSAYLPGDQDLMNATTEAAAGYRASDLASSDPRRRGAAQDTRDIKRRMAASDYMTETGQSPDQYQRGQDLRQAMEGGLADVSMETRARVGLADATKYLPSTGFTTGGKDPGVTGRRSDESVEQFAARRQDIAQTKMNRADDQRQIRRHLGNQAAMRRAANAFYKSAVASGDPAMAQAALQAAAGAGEPAPVTGMARVQGERQQREMAASALANQYLPDPTKIGVAQIGAEADRYRADREADAARQRADTDRYGIDRRADADIFGASRKADTDRYTADRQFDAAMAGKPTTPEKRQQRIDALSKRHDEIMQVYQPRMGQGMMSDGSFKTPEIPANVQGELRQITMERDQLTVQGQLEQGMDPRAILSNYLARPENADLARRAAAGDQQARAQLQAWIDAMGLESMQDTRAAVLGAAKRAPARAAGAAMPGAAMGFLPGVN